MDDFDELTPQLLRAAYVEALYRVDEFEFERLTQSYWHALIGKVSDSMSTQPLFDMYVVNCIACLLVPCLAMMTDG